MKKLTSLLLSLSLIIAAPLTSLAASAPSKDYDPNPTTGHGAWSYVKVAPVSGEVSRTHYIYSNYETTTPPIEGKISSCDGLTYNKKNNTLTISKFTQEDMVLTAHNMGTGFAIKLSGKNEMRSIKVENDGWDSGLSISGSGNITLGNDSDHNRIPLDINGNLTINSGTIKCIAEKTDIQSIAGLRQTVQIRSTSKTPLTTAVAYKGELAGTESTNDTFLVSSKDSVTFSGKAITEKPDAKRKGKKVSWFKLTGYKSQYKIGSKIKTTTKASVKSAKKLQIRYIKTSDGIMTVGAWSKKI